jgi:AAA domain/Bifunctional DNA primase/polymerase, N-terminal
MVTVQHNLQIALKWAAAGAAVFPVEITIEEVGVKKKPRLKWRDQSTTDPEIIKNWWRDWPDSAPGIDLGKAGIVVLDGDRHGGPDGVEGLERLFEEHRLTLSAIPIVVTPQNEGRHAWFKQPTDGEPLGNRDRAVKDSGINVRGNGGFVIAPGTVLADGRRYQRLDGSPSTIESFIYDTMPVLPPSLAELLRSKSNGHDQQATQFVNGHSFHNGREETYALATLDSLAKELGAATSGGRNITLNNCAMRIGHMIGAGWIARHVVEQRLFEAAQACGLLDEDGFYSVKATIKSGIDAGEKEPHPPLTERNGYSSGASATRGTKQEKQTSGSWKFHTNETVAPPRWLIKNILTQTGTALIAGQWGTFKTTVALDIALSIMAELPFAGRYRIKRRGGVLFIALEGERMLSVRLDAMAAERGITGLLPFAWRGDCPSLTDGDAGEALCKLADEAAAEFQSRFGLPVAMIVVDTIVRAANHTEGGDNDAAASQRVMNALSRLSNHIGALVIGIDHFGKVVETGTRGSSAKEGAADTVLALLADRELSGGVKNTRLAIRKQRDGVSGFEIPFTVRTIETGTDEDGDPTTAQMLEWQATQKPEAQNETGWTPSLQLLRRVVTTILADHGRSITPFADGPTVRGCDLELVRTEFYRQYPAEGVDKQKQAARQKAFKRSLNGAVPRSLIAIREVEGVQLIWLPKEAESHASPRTARTHP